MDQFPDSDEEFDLMHEDEFENLRELEAENYTKSTNIQQKPISQSQNSKNYNEINKQYLQPNKKSTESDSVEVQKNNVHLSQHLQATQLSANNSNDTQINIGHIKNVVVNGENTKKKRTVEEILRDCDELIESCKHDGIYDDLERFEQSIKRPRWDQPEEIMKVILAARKKHQELNIGNILHKKPEYKINKESITTKVPTWNFFPITRSHDGQRFYVKVKNIDESVIPKIRSASGLLSVPYNQLKDEADKIIVKNVERLSMPQPTRTDVDIVNDELWVDKYRPKKYMELLSDESVNRTFLRWLKLWDKIVFNKEILKQKNHREKSIFKNKITFFQMEDEVQLDEKDFPKHRIVLLSGPPGLGKTTLAHVAARHAGYNIVEINASDDRSPEAFREALLSSTQMQAVLDSERRPNCLILDEIDGAPASSIDLLLKFVHGKLTTKGKKSKESKVESCRRPVICICNEVYTPSLRPLKAAALVIPVPEINLSILTDRLLEIAQKEGLRVDQRAVQQLVERSGCDIRTCLGALQYMGGVDLKQNTSLGLKDTKLGLFDAWKEIFQVPINRQGIVPPSDRVKNILRIAQQGETDRLAQGTFHNYPTICKENLDLVSESLDWFQMFDNVTTLVATHQIWTIMPYTNYAFSAWHLNFAVSKNPKLSYPTVTFEMNQKLSRSVAILSTVQKTCGLDRVTLCLDITPFLPEILSPRLRSVSAHLYSSKEKVELVRLINIMVDYGLTLVQEKKPEGGYQYNLDPNIHEVGTFSDCKVRRSLSYAVKQIIIQELEIERLKRAASMFATNETNSKCDDKKKKIVEKEVPSVPSISSKSEVPNHLKKLDPVALKPVEKNCYNFFETFMTLGNKKVEEKMAEKRNSSSISENAAPATSEEEETKSCVWYKFKEGFSNAVRRTILMEDVL